MKKIYVVQVELPTFINRIVRIITGYKYNHFSISLDDSLKKLYSFQVKNMHTMLVGGFLEEKEVYYLHAKKNLKLKEFIYEIPVSDREYSLVKEFIYNISNDNEYIFNYISALFMFSFGGIKAYKAFHCTEFIAEILSLLDDVKLPKESHLMRSKDLYKVLINYQCTEKIISSNDYKTHEKDIFFRKIKSVDAIKKIIYSIKESFCRVLFKRTSKNYDYKKVNFFEKNCRRK